jgi:hypothetical protein
MFVLCFNLGWLLLTIVDMLCIVRISYKKQEQPRYLTCKLVNAYLVCSWFSYKSYFVGHYASCT